MCLLSIALIQFEKSQQPFILNDAVHDISRVMKVAQIVWRMMNIIAAVFWMRIWRKKEAKKIMSVKNSLQSNPY